MADNKVRYGLSNVHVAFKTAEGYGTPIHIPGSRSLSTDPQGEQSNWYADNIPYVTFSSNAGYEGDLEMALFPDTVLAEMLGWAIDANGAIVEDANGKPKSFALLFEIEGDVKNRRNVFYNVTAARPSTENSTTEDSIEPQTETMPITMIPAQFDGRNITKASMEPNETNQTAYDGFFTAVYTPTFTTEGAETTDGADGAEG